MKLKIKELSEYLLSKTDFFKIKKSQFYSAVEGARAERGGLKTTEKGLQFLQLHYTGVLVFDSIPAEKTGYLVTMTNAWIADNDDNREGHKLQPPKYHFLEVSERESDAEVNIDFVDDFYLVEKEDGPIQFNGRNWDLGEYDLHTAEKLTGIETNIK